MGLKNKLNKMKSFLFDEEEEDYKKNSKKSLWAWKMYTV